jgi:squalene synthase HpnC
MNQRTELDSAYKSALKFANRHYENFPVASLLIPRKQRKHVAVIYWFARTADDFADEGNFTNEQRLNMLNQFEERFYLLLKGNFTNEFESALHNTITKLNLTPSLFIDLLKAFKQDAVKKRYNNYNELIEYCKSSANPIGRLILELFNIRNDMAFNYSDDICTALQLTNFYQDIQLDFSKGRIYLPLNEMEQFGVDEKIFEKRKNNLNFKQLLTFNIERTSKLFENGRKLLQFLPARLKFEIKLTILGGEEILQKIISSDFDVFHKRQTLNMFDRIKLIFKAAVKK